MALNQLQQKNQAASAYFYASVNTWLAEQLDSLRWYSSHHSNFFWADFFPPEPDPYKNLPCLKFWVNTIQPEEIAASLSPNPAHDFSVLKLKNQPVGPIQLLNVSGKPTRTFSTYFFENQEVTLSLEGIPPGIYFLKWFEKNGQHRVAKLVVF